MSNRTTYSDRDYVNQRKAEIKAEQKAEELTQLKEEHPVVVSFAMKRKGGSFCAVEYHICKDKVIKTIEHDLNLYPIVKNKIMLFLLEQASEEI